MQKIVNVESKVGLRSSIMIRDLDIHCFKDHRPSNSISSASKVFNQGMTIKELRPKEFKTKEMK